jgi:hypothetical protein
MSRILTLITLCAGLYLNNPALAANLNLPTNDVTFYADGADDSFFVVSLSNVPPGYDVHNGLYLGWCASFYVGGSPTGASHTGHLYSSLDPNLPPSFAESWGYINYVLNHKQGSGDDIQSAIWYFTDSVTWNPTAASQAMINAALAHGQNFQPGPGEVAAVVVAATDNSQIQVVIIEAPVPVPPVPCDDFVTGGGWIIGPGGAKANFGVHGGIRHGNFWGGLNYIDHATRMHVHSTGTTSYVHVDQNTRRIGFNVKINGIAGTAIVTVTDNGEPGTHDIFDIQLSTGYSAGGELGGTVKRGGGGNIQLHKGHCK